MKNLLLLLLPLWFSKTLLAQSTPDDIVGIWYSPVKKGKVQIYKNGNQYVGKLIELNPAVDQEGNPLLDVHNPDPEKRKRPLIGIALLRDLVYNGEKKSWKGKLYDYDGAKGNTYDSYLTITENGQLNIKGFWGLSFFGLNPGLTLNRVATE